MNTALLISFPELPKKDKKYFVVFKGKYPIPVTLSWDFLTLNPSQGSAGRNSLLGLYIPKDTEKQPAAAVYRQTPGYQVSVWFLVMMAG